MEDPILEFTNWYRKLTPTLLFSLTTTFIIGLCCSYEIVNPQMFAYTFESTFYGLELWRPFTSVLFFGKFSLIFIYSMIMIFKIINKHEQILFYNDYAGFIWTLFILYSWTFLVCNFLRVYYMGNSFFFALLYIWAQYRPLDRTRLFLGIQINCQKLPMFFMVFSVLLNESLVDFLIGYMVGMVYMFFKIRFATKFNIDILKTPFFMKKIFGSRRREPERMAQQY